MLLLYTLLITVGIILSSMGVEILKQLPDSDDGDSILATWIWIFILLFVGVFLIILGITNLISVQ